MNKLNKVKTILSRYPYSISFEEKDHIIFLNGEVNSYEEKVEIANKIAKSKTFEHVVNNIIVKGLTLPKIRYNESINTNELDNLECDVLVIGGGVIGCSILRELSKYQINAILLEKENDVALHASSRNDGNIHPGIDLHRNTLKLKYLNKARDMWPTLAKDLDFKYVKTGQALAYGYDKPIIKFYVKHQAKKNNVKNVSYYSHKQFLAAEPNIDNPKVKGGIIFNDAAQVAPYEVTIAFAENAITNGAKVYLDTYVKDMVVENNEIKGVITNRGTIKPKVVINAAGVFSENIAKMAHDHFFSIHPRKGTDIILDKKVFNKYARHTLGFKSIKDAMAKTKGGGIIVTVDDNFLIGPDAVETPYQEDFATEKASILSILNKQKSLFRNISTKDIITYFSGIRACTYEEDFVIQKGKWTKNIIHAAGIQSPGLTCAPSIGLDVANLAISYFPNVKKKDDFIKERKGIVNFASLSIQEKDALIVKNRNYGSIVCRCEKVSKQEIIEALHRPLPANTVDAIKRRVRVGMGRCQGGFCTPQVLKIMAEEKKVDYLDIKKKGEAHILTRKNK